MDQHQVLSNEHMEALQSPYKCKHCGEGSMIQAVHEGEAEYSDHYQCDKCHYHDYIPTTGVLFSQISTSVLGFALCVFLAYEYILFETNDAVPLSAKISLSMIVTGFILGFVYVLYKGFLGYKVRRAYLKH